MPGAGGRQIRIGTVFKIGAGLMIGSGLMRGAGLMVGTGLIVDVILGFVMGPLHEGRLNVRVRFRRVVRVTFLF